MKYTFILILLFNLQFAMMNVEWDDDLIDKVESLPFVSQIRSAVYAMKGDKERARLIQENFLLTHFPELHSKVDFVEVEQMKRIPFEYVVQGLNNILDTTCFEDAYEEILLSLVAPNPIRQTLDQCLAWIFTGRTDYLPIKALNAIPMDEDSIVRFIRSLFDTQEEYDSFVNMAWTAIGNFEASFKISRWRLLFSSRTETSIRGMLNTIEFPSLLREAAIVFEKANLYDRYRQNLPQFIRDIRNESVPFINRETMKPLKQAVIATVSHLLIRASLSESNDYYWILNPLSKLSRSLLMGVQEFISEYAPNAAKEFEESLKGKIEKDCQDVPRFRFLKVKEKVNQLLPPDRINDEFLDKMCALSGAARIPLIGDFARVANVRAIWKRIFYVTNKWVHENLLNLYLFSSQNTGGEKKFQ